jgi:pimeloyl-ACP methyl ester carboxylesterase
MKFLLIGGLGDSIESLRPWINALILNHQQYQYIPVSVTGNSGFDHRVRRLRSQLAQEGRPVCIIGQSAGALAALMVASDSPAMVRGVIAVSPAMPKGISPLSLSLMSVMWKYYHHMYMSHLIEVNPKDYTRLALNGVSKPEILLENRDKISGREAYELATDSLQPRLGEIYVPVVHVYGTKDRWVNPRAQRKLSQLLGNKKISIAVGGAGHLPTHHHKGERVIADVLYELSRLIATFETRT